MLLVIHPRYDLKVAQLFESVWSYGNCMFLWLNLYFLMISNMFVARSWLPGFNNVLIYASLVCGSSELCLANLLFFQYSLCNSNNRDVMLDAHVAKLTCQKNKVPSVYRLP
jgi:hypothetical protein